MKIWQVKLWVDGFDGELICEVPGTDADDAAENAYEMLQHSGADAVEVEFIEVQD